MRIDKKTLTKGTLILLSSITIIPNMVLASEATVIDDTHYYNNYYFFTGRYDDCLIYTPGSEKEEYRFLNTKEGGTNETSFASLNFGYSDTTGTKIKLSLNPKQKKNSDDWTYEGFYRKILEVEKSKGTPYTIDGTECEIKHIEENGKKNTTTTYFAHGCYTNDDGKLTSSNNLKAPLKYQSDNLAVRALACSSVDIPYKISNFSINNDRVDVEISRTIDDKLKITTYKKLPEVSNTTQCKETYLMPLNIEGSCHPTYNVYGKYLYDNKPYALYAPALYKLSYEVSKHTCQEKNMDTASMKCNNTLSVEETCPNQTMINEAVNIKQDISITQNHYASNILTPTTIHQGGGVKFAVEYYSEIKWSPSDRNNVSGAIGDLNSQEVINYINNKELYKGNDINATIKVFQIDKNNNKKTVAEIPTEKQCTIEGWSKDNGVNLLKRKCTFSMPNYELSQYDGKVTLSNDEPSSNGVNNRYYTDLNFDGKYEFKFEISNISMLKEKYDWLKKDSETITVKSDNEDASCQVETVPVNDFVYRPIDLDKPFPNRTPGLNWLEWYSNSTNKERLKEAYDKNNLQYLAVLNNQNVMAIKGYNKNNKYLDWSDIDSDGNSTFITKNKNIVTRQSSTEEGGS